MAISDYSTTAASNTSISGIDISGATGKVKDGDNAIRQMMADIKAGVPYLSGTSYLFESTDAGATVGPVLDIYRNSASPAASDDLGQIIWNGEDDAGNKQEFANVTARISDPASGSEDGALLFRAHKAGATTNYLFIGLNAAGTATPDAIGLPRGNLSFPASQVASSDPNTLDDYEEGSTTPAVTAGSGTFTSASCALNYTKVGDRVSFDATITITTNGTAASSVIIQLPFTSAAGSAFAGFSSSGNVAVIGTTGASSTNLPITKYDGTYPGGSGVILRVSGNYKV